MPDEFDIIFDLVLGFFVETIIVLVILIRLDQPRDRTYPTDDRHGTEHSTRARRHLRSSHHKANKSTSQAAGLGTPRQPGVITNPDPRQTGPCS
jgi:hypothetical protein